MPKHHPTPLSGGDRKALQKELVKARAMTGILAGQAAEKRARGEQLSRQADNLDCQSWNERMWSDGEPIDPSPTVNQAINGGFPWLEIRCSRCKTPSRVDLCTMRRRQRPSSTILRAACGASNASPPGTDRPRRCSNWHLDRATSPPAE